MNVMQPAALDAFDISILAELQGSARLSSVELGEKVELSQSQVHRRMKRLEQTGAIRGYAALLDPAHVNLNLMAFTSVSLEIQTKKSSKPFNDAIAKMPEVLECYCTTGDADYLLKIVARDLPHFSDLLMNQIMPLPHVRNLRSSVVLVELKNTTVFGLDHLLTESAASR